MFQFTNLALHNNTTKTRGGRPQITALKRATDANATTLRGQLACLSLKRRRGGEGQGAGLNLPLHSPSASLSPFRWL